MTLALSQVALFRDRTKSQEVGRAVWAALQEIEQFYNLGAQRIASTRTYVSDDVPGGLADQGTDAMTSFAGRTWEGLFEEGRSLRTHRAGSIVKATRKLLGPEGRGPPYFIITDLELSPPPEWRYIIFDGDMTGVVVSIAPIDPDYWSISDPNRIALIKHRARTAGLCVTGQMLGLQRCNNRECFLYGDIGSVTCLDAMVELGPEHRITELERRGYEVYAAVPEQRQAVTREPISVIDRPVLESRVLE